MFCEESLGEINGKDVKIFQNGWVHESYCLKALIALEQVNTLEVGQKKRKVWEYTPLFTKTSLCPTKLAKSYFLLATSICTHIYFFLARPTFCYCRVDLRLF